MATKVTRDDSFGEYENSYVVVNDNGRSRKYFVKPLNKENIVTNFSVLEDNPYTISGLSDKQECDQCDEPCFANVPVIQLVYNNPTMNAGDLELGYYNEEHDIFINGTKVCRLHTADLNAVVNKLWLIPYYTDNVTIPTDVAMAYQKQNGNSLTTAFSAVFFDPSIYQRNNWNTLAIEPHSAYNPATDPASLGYDDTIKDMFYTPFGDAVTNFDYPGLYLHNIIETNGTSSIGCSAWKVQQFNDIAEYERNSFTFTLGSGYIKGCDHGITLPVWSSHKILGPTENLLSVTFGDLNPCSNPTTPPTNYSGYNIDPQWYYLVSQATNPARFAHYDDIDFNIGDVTDTSNNTHAPRYFRKFVYYTDDNFNEEVVLYKSRGVFGSFSDRQKMTYYTDLGLTRYTGFYHTSSCGDGRRYKTEINNGHLVSSYFY